MCRLTARIPLFIRVRENPSQGSGSESSTIFAPTAVQRRRPVNSWLLLDRAPFVDDTQRSRELLLVDESVVGRLEIRDQADGPIWFEIVVVRTAQGIGKRKLIVVEAQDVRLDVRALERAVEYPVGPAEQQVDIDCHLWMAQQPELRTEQEQVLGDIGAANVILVGWQRYGAIVVAGAGGEPDD